MECALSFAVGNIVIDNTRSLSLRYFKIRRQVESKVIEQYGNSLGDEGKPNIIRQLLREIGSWRNGNGGTGILFFIFYKENCSGRPVSNIVQPPSRYQWFGGIIYRMVVKARFYAAHDSECGVS